MIKKRRTVSKAKRLLTLMGLLAFCLAVALPLFATERREPGSAMRSASRLDAWRVVMSPDGIELRDYQNRLISRQGLRRELRAGERAAAGEAADLSLVPGLRALLAYLDRVDLNADALRGGAGRGERRAAVSAILPLRSPKIAPSPIRLLGAAPSGRAEPILSPLQFTLTPGRVRVQVLRL